MDKEVISYAICCGEHLIWASTNIDSAVAYYKHLGGNEGCLRFVVTFNKPCRSLYWD